ncbi:MAG: DUF502 domain-containing protein [Alphaproteobacteria bacterium]|nr:DUF502 domain-containing protein [Alphaproteobacteria bacterium]
MSTEEPDHEPPKSSIARRLRGYLLAGVLVTAPITLTVYLTYLFLTFVDAKVVGLLPNDLYERYYAHTTVPGIGLLVAVTFFMTVGWLATNFLGRTVIRVSEYFVDKMPVIRTVYGVIKQILETVMASKGNAFREAVMLQYPREGIWSIGFVTGKAEGEVQRLTEHEVVNVFLPTTPNPTSGFLLFVPKKDLIFLEMSVEEAVKLVVSAGIVNPDENKRKKKGTKAIKAETK